MAICHNRRGGGCLSPAGTSEHVRTFPLVSHPSCFMGPCGSSKAATSAARLETSPPCMEQITYSCQQGATCPLSYSLHLRGLTALPAVLTTDENVSPFASFRLGTYGLHLLMKTVVTTSGAGWSLLLTQGWSQGHCGCTGCSLLVLAWTAQTFLAKSAVC